MINHVALNIIFMMGLVFTVASQESKSLKTTQHQTSSSLAPEKVEEIQNKIARIESHLQAIETKRAYVLSSESETQLATESGWFASMAEIQEQLIAKKAELISYLNSFDDE
jgi:CRISPR/Cas system CMR-associated protein Cmr5 small subunit